MNSALVNVLQKNKTNFRSVVDFNPAKEKLVKLDFTETNTELTVTDISNTEKFSQYIHNKLTQANAKFGIGGYNENRILYKRSKLFEGTEERTIHLGIDIWGAVGTKVHVPVGGVVHSFAFNNNFGDYGATIILQHQLDTIVFYTLYGHLSLNDLNNLKEGKYISRGEILAHFGDPKENGDWPPHLHFQIINDIRLNKGDYPGVCTVSESEKYLDNCPDPDLILGMMKYAV
jgi:murein DD-endopeptidase MepM/ murein hydrolase activator NlpD